MVQLDYRLGVVLLVGGMLLKFYFLILVCGGGGTVVGLMTLERGSVGDSVR